MSVRFSATFLFIDLFFFLLAYSRAVHTSATNVEDDKLSDKLSAIPELTASRECMMRGPCSPQRERRRQSGADHLHPHDRTLSRAANVSEVQKATDTSCI